MDAQQYLDILKTYLKENKPRFKFYQYNDPKHRSNMVRMWQPYNSGKVIDTPVQGSDLNSIENL